jgi:PAS domain S-box-containing protein
MMVDLDGCIRDVNVAFERVTGYRRDEVIGQNPRLLKSGLHPATFYEDMWATIAAGGQWSGEMVDRRKDGTFFIVETVVSPVRDASGAVEGFVSVQTDVTERRALAAQSANSGAERTLVLAGVSGLSTNSSREANAQAICRTVAGLSGVAAAQMVVFESSSEAMPIGQVVAGREDLPLHCLSFQISRRLHTQSAHGAWIEPWANRQGRAYNQLVEHAGPSSLACAPVFCGKRLVGLLTVQCVDVTNKGAVNDLLPIVGEFAAVAGGVLGSQMAELIDARSGREHISNILKRHAFRPVFQPIVDIFLDKVVGYEALTRFTDGSNPETLFAEAKEVHLGIELETATLKAALGASMALPPNVWLNINASPELILDDGQLRFLISGIRRPLVVEVTEHTAIADYPEFRTAMAALGPGTRLAVDDAGAGFAGLRHIFELRPAFLKLDRWLVAGVESDKARQAMIAGLRHFAGQTGCLLIAEGIETQPEIEALRSLDVHLGQGYALGRPQAVEALPPVPVPVVAAHR